MVYPHAVRPPQRLGYGLSLLACVSLAFAVDEPPTIATAASSVPAEVTATTTKLSVLGADDGGPAALTYAWSASGPATVTFSATGTNAAKAVTATFKAPGDYVFTATTRDVSGQTATSIVGVKVLSTPKTFSVAPNAVTTTVKSGATKTFTATLKNQFGQVLAGQTPVWSIAPAEAGAISATGVLTGGEPGAAKVTAVVGAFTGSVPVWIVDAAVVPLTVPAQSYLAPICAEGYANPVDNAVLRVNGSQVAVTPKGSTTWYANLNVAPDVSTPVAVTVGSTTTVRNTIWSTFDFDTVAADVVLDARLNDQVNLRSSQTILLSAPTGASQISNGQVQLSSAGTWTFASGARSLSVKVYAPSVEYDPTQPISVMVNSGTWLYPIPATPDVSGVFLTSNDPFLMADVVGGKAAFSGLSVGVRQAVVRVGSNTGPIFGLLPVTVYTIDMTRVTHPKLLMPDGKPVPPPRDGAMMRIISGPNTPLRSQCTLVVKPHVPNLRLNVAKFAHQSTFLGGATSFKVMTDGTPTSLGEPGVTAIADVTYNSVSQLSFTLVSPAAGNMYHCIKVVPTAVFHGEPVQPASVAMLLQEN